LLQTRIKLLGLDGLTLILFFVLVQRRAHSFSTTGKVKEKFLAFQSMVKKSLMVIGILRVSLSLVPKINF